MKSLEKFLTRKNLYIGNIVSGILMALIVSIFYTLSSSQSGGNPWSALSNALSGLGFACTLYYVDIVLVVLLTASWGFRLYRFKEKKENTVILLITCIVAFILSFFMLPTINALSSVANMNLGAMLGSASHLENLESLTIPFWIWVLAHLSYLLEAIIFMRADKKGDNSEEPSKLEESGKRMLEKFRNTAATPKGKKKIIVIVTSCVVVIVSCLGFGVYSMFKKVPIDLVSDVKVTFTGYDGEGMAQIEGTPDYDHTNADISSFIAGITYDIENDGQLSNGEKVTISANYSKETANSLKLDVTKASMTVEVSGLQEVYRTWEDISKKDQKTILDKLKDKVTKKAKDASYQLFSEETITLDSLKPIASYYTYGSGTGTLYALYKADLTSTSKDKKEHHVEYYWALASGLKPDGDALDKYDIDVSTLYARDDSEEDVIDEVEEYRVDPDNKIEIPE